MLAHLNCYPMELIDFHKQKPLLESKEFCLATIYHEKGAQPLWITSDGPGNKARVKAMFDEFDVNKNGIIEKKEFMLLFKNQLGWDEEKSLPFFKVYDLDTDGQITLDEFETIFMLA